MTSVAQVVDVDAVEKPFLSPVSGKKMAQVSSAPFCIFMPLNWLVAAFWFRDGGNRLDAPLLSCLLG
jgi:hypothetical protein